MFLRVFTLVLALVAQVSAQNCTLCAGGAVPERGDLVLFTGFTCNEIATQLTLTPLDMCIEVLDVGFGFDESPLPFVCGCPGVMAGKCSGLCKGNTELKKEILLDVDATCETVDLLAKATSNKTICNILRDESPSGEPASELCCTPKGKGMSMGMNTRKRSLQARGGRLTDVRAHTILRGL